MAGGQDNSSTKLKNRTTQYQYQMKYYSAGFCEYPKAGARYVLFVTSFHTTSNIMLDMIAR